MADNVVDLSIKVNTETGQIEVLGQKLKGLGKDAGQTKEKFGGLSAGAKELVGALGGIVTAAGIAAFFKGAVTEAEAFNESMRRVKFAVEANGISWAQNGDAIAAWAQQLQQTTRFGDTEALNTLGRLTRVTGDLAQAQQASKVAMGLSVASGKDLAATTELMSQVMSGNERAVRQARLEFGSFIGNARTAQEVATALNSAFADTATQEESFTKETAKLKNAFGDFQKQIGQVLLGPLAGLLSWGTAAIEMFQKVGIAFGSLGALIFTQAEQMAKIIKAVLTGNFKDIPIITREASDKVSIILQESAAELRAVEKQKTAIIAEEADKRTQLMVRPPAEDPAKIAEEEAKAKAKIERQMAQRIEAHNKETQTIAQLERQLDQQLGAIGEQTLAKKQAALTREVNLQRTKIVAEVKNEVEKQKLLDKLRDYEFKQNQALAQADMQIKFEAALKIVDTAVQTLGILNSLGEGHSKEEARRAKMILALEKAIAIARAIAAAQSAGPFAGAVAAAQIALIAAQFAQQSRAIDAAQRASQQQAGQGFSSISRELPFGEGVFTEGQATGPGFVGINPADLQTGAGGGLVGPGLGGDVRTGALALTGGGAAPGGGAAGVQVNMSITLNLSPNTLDISDIRTIMKRLAEELRAQATPEAIQLALAAANAATKYANLAA